MASFVYAVWSITNVASVHCSVRPEISPCTCEPIIDHNYVELSCEKVDSFHQIVDALSRKFEPNVNISLKISHSQLDDLEMRSFTDMNFNVVKLRLQWNSLRSMPELPFRGLSNLELLSVGDNELEEIPKHMLNHMPMVKTLDIGRCRLRSVLQDDLKGIQMVTYLFLPSNNISRLDKGAFPPNLITLHLGRNQIESLNGTLRDLNKLESLFINMNSISSLDDELPESNHLKLLLAHNNRLDHLPEMMRYLDNLETLHLQHNLLTSLDGIFKDAKNLVQFYAFNNQLEYLATDEFRSSDMLEDFDLSLNRIRSLNYSLLPLTHLYNANFSFNEMAEFSMHEIRGLRHLKKLDLSHNRIAKLSGRQDNSIDQDSFLVQFHLHHNELRSLDGALMGLNSLRILSLSHNRIERILPEDFIGLTKLEILELSHNNLLTLSEMETTYLPNLKILKVDYNNLTKLERDFHGLPVLCIANLSNNHISSISTDLVSKTRCKNHNVPGQLEMHLEDNPIMCDERLNELCPRMLTMEARIRGKSACFDSDQEVCKVLPMLLRPALLASHIPIVIHHHLNQAPNARPVVKVIVESPILLNNNLKEDLLPPLINPLILAQAPTMQLAPITTSSTTTATTTTTTTPKPTTTTTSSSTTTTTTTPQPPDERKFVEITTTPSVKSTNLEDIVMPPVVDGIAMKSFNQSTLQITEEIEPGDGASNKLAANMAPPLIRTLLVSGTANNEAQELITSTQLTPPPLVLHIDEPPTKAGTTALDDHQQQKFASDQSQIVVAATNEASVAANHTSAGAALPLGGNTQPKQAPSEYATLEYIPNFDEYVANGQQPPPDVLDEDSKTNSVHEEFPSVVLADLDNAQQSLLIPAEPPENP